MSSIEQPSASVSAAGPSGAPVEPVQTAGQRKYQRNRARALAYSRAYYQAHKAERQAVGLAHYYANREEVKATNLARYHAKVAETAALKEELRLLKSARAAPVDTNNVGADAKAQ